MSRLRGTGAVAIVLVAAVIAAFLFNALLHSIVPHSHDGGEAIWQELHAALRHDEKKAVVGVVAVLSTAVLPLLVLTFSIPRLQPVTADAMLRRGVHKYRKFR